MNINSIIESIENRIALGSELESELVAADLGIQVAADVSENRMPSLPFGVTYLRRGAGENLTVQNAYNRMLYNRRGEKAFKNILKNAIPGSATVVFSNTPNSPFWKMIASQLTQLVIFPLRPDSVFNIRARDWEDKETYFVKDNIVAFKENSILRYHEDPAHRNNHRLIYDARGAAAKTIAIGEAFAEVVESPEAAMMATITETTRMVNQFVRDAESDQYHLTSLIERSVRAVSRSENAIEQARQTIIDQERQIERFNRELEENRLALDIATQEDTTKLTAKMNLLKSKFNVTSEVEDLDSIEECNFTGASYRVVTHPLTMNLKESLYDIGEVSFDISNSGDITVSTTHPLVTAANPVLDLGPACLPVIEALGRGEITKAIRIILGVLSADLDKRPRGYSRSRNTNAGFMEVVEVAAEV